MFFVRRKDPPIYEGQKTPWITVAKRDTKQQAEIAVKVLKKISKRGTHFWVGEEKEMNE